MVDREETGTISGEGLYAPLDPPRSSSAFSSCGLLPVDIVRGLQTGVSAARGRNYVGKISRPSKEISGDRVSLGTSCRFDRSNIYCTSHRQILY